MPNDVPIISFIPWLFLFAIYYASIHFILVYHIAMIITFHFSEEKSILFILRFCPPVPQLIVSLLNACAQ